MQDASRPNRLRWRCRRGMKELDVLLERFLERESAALAAGDWPQFEQLLETEDDLLWAWLRDGSAAGAAPFTDLLKAIGRD